MIKIYGSPRTSAGRCYLMAEECGVKYETMPLDMKEKREHKSESFLKLNPNGKVPVMVDGDFVLWESLAIDFYLAEKYKPELLGSGAEEKGKVHQWSTWAMVELQPPLVDMIIQLMFVPEEKRDHGLVAKARDKVPPMLAILDKSLSGKSYLVGNKVTVADIVTVSVVNIAAHMKIPTENYSHLTSWFSRMKERPSFKRLMELRG